MPATREAAALTDRYRDRVLGQGSTAGSAAAATLAGVDLDLSRTRISRYLLQWAAVASTTVVNAQSATAGLTDAYVRGYLAASLAPIVMGPSVDLTAHVGVTRGGDVDALFRTAAKGLLWRLGQGAGRDAALTYGQALATRGAAVAVSDTARDTLTDLMVASPEIVGYRRVTAPSTCGRCAQAAMRVYQADVLLPRHPSCRCTQEPVLRTAAKFARPAPAVVRP